MKSHFEIIQIFGDSARLADAIGVSQGHGRVLWYRIKRGGNLPVEHWRPIIRAARERGHRVTYAEITIAAVKRRAA